MHGRIVIAGVHFRYGSREILHGIDLTVDGAIGRQTQTAIDAATIGAGIPTDVPERAKLAVIRALGIPGGLADDGPRLVRTDPALCGDGIGWVDTPSEVLCLAPR